MSASRPMIFAFVMAASLGATAAWTQEKTNRPSVPPVNFGFNNDPFEDADSPVSPDSGGEEEHSLEFIKKTDGYYALSSLVLEVIQSIDPEARGEWDGASGVLRIRAEGKQIQVLANQPLIVIDNKSRSVSKPIVNEGGSAYLPRETVYLLFKALGYEMEDAQTSTSDAKVSDAEPEADDSKSSAPGVPPSLTLPSDDAVEVTPWDLEPGRTGRPPSGSLLSPLDDAALPELRVPGIGAKVVELAWKDLADFMHRRPAESMTLACDREVLEVADRVGRYVARALGLNVATEVIEDRRRTVATLAGIERGNPDLIVELIALDPAESWGIEDAQFEVWAVHDALWPNSARDLAPSAATPLNQRYQLHQFQNLALASMLSGELAKGFPHRMVQFDIMPSYLLRRVDAPAAAVLIPTVLFRGGRPVIERTSRAIAAGIIAYCKGMDRGRGQR